MSSDFTVFLQEVRFDDIPDGAPISSLVVLLFFWFSSRPSKSLISLSDPKLERKEELD